MQNNTAPAKKKQFWVLLAALFVLCGIIAICGVALFHGQSGSDVISYDDACKELETFYKVIEPTQLPGILDLNIDESSVAASLADISTFPTPVHGSGVIDIEIACCSEFVSDAPDDWLCLLAEAFNHEAFRIDGKTVSVTMRNMPSGEVLTYMLHGGYHPDVYIPSNEAWGKMLDASSIQPICLCERLAGNTAGILMKKHVYETFQSQYGEVTVDKVLESAIAGDLVFAYTNPYTSSTGLNILSAMLYAFDPDDPLSETAVGKLIDYQKNAPTAAYTTAVLKNAAAKGIIDAMVMEEQAYIQTPELTDYVFTPAGIRHDHPVYTFSYVSEEHRQVADMFVSYCLREESQQMATERGFNRHEEYVSQENGMDGEGYLAAQKVWKKNKNGGRPVVAVFVADISGSMNGSRMTALKNSLLETMQYIDRGNYIGLVTYSDQVYINLPVAQFDDLQRAYFSGAVKDLSAGGNTATYDATLVGLQMLLDMRDEVPDAKMMLFVLSDGAQNKGYVLERVTPIVAALHIPVYTIGYEMMSTDKEALQKLSEINEATCIDADVEGIVNDLRNLFNVNM